MKKVLITICCAVLVALLALTAAGCSSAGNLKDSFKKAGYEVTQIKAEDCSELNTQVKNYVTNLNKKIAEEQKEKEEKNSKNNSKSKDDKDKDKDDKKKKEIKVEDVIGKFKVYTVTNGNRKGAFIKFPDKGALELTFGESKYKTEDEKGYIKGDCYFLTTCTIDGTKFCSAVNYDVLHIFKNA